MLTERRRRRRRDKSELREGKTEVRPESRQGEKSGGDGRGAVGGQWEGSGRGAEKERERSGHVIRD